MGPISRLRPSGSLSPVEFEQASKPFATSDGSHFGWLAAGESFRNESIIFYHKNWVYFEERFKVRCADYVEAKPGIPPTPRHVADLIDLMQEQGLGVVLAASYYDRNKVETVAERGGARAVIVSLSPVENGEPPNYFALVDLWVSQLAAAFAAMP